MSVVSQLLLVVIAAIALQIYVDFPPPELSTKLQAWREKGKYFNFKGFAVFYRDDQGSGDPRSVLLCIHGFPTSSYDFSKIWAPLRSKFGRVIAVDMLDHGFSDKPKNREFLVKEQATISELILHSLGIKKVHIISHDLGDTVALEILARFGESSTPTISIESFCLSNGGIFPETNFPKLIQKALINPWLGSVLKYFSNRFIFYKSLSDIFGPNSKPLAEECIDFYAMNRYKNGNEVVSRVLDYINQRSKFRERWVGAMRKSSIKVHLIYGPSDPINPPVMLERFRELVPNGTYTKLDQSIGHYPHWEDPEGFLNGYFDYLKSKEIDKEIDQIF